MLSADNRTWDIPVITCPLSNVNVQVEERPAEPADSVFNRRPVAARPN
jgi:hypothetical protein